jgi:hypothetical protein
MDHSSSDMADLGMPDYVGQSALAINCEAQPKKTKRSRALLSQYCYCEFTHGMYNRRSPAHVTGRTGNSVSCHLIHARVETRNE